MYYQRKNADYLENKNFLEAAFLMKAPHFAEFYYQETYLHLMINS